MKLNNDLSDYLKEDNTIQIDLKDSILRNILILLYPMSPHIASEIFQDYFDSDISQEKWPTFDETKLENPVYELVIQINGKKRHALIVNTGIEEDEVKEICTTNFDIDFSDAKKVIFIKDKLINICLLYTSPSPRDPWKSRMPSSA